jgi:hypothetical protein
MSDAADGKAILGPPIELDSSSILDLPIELLLEILIHLHPLTVVGCRQASSFFSKTVASFTSSSRP